MTGVHEDKLKDGRGELVFQLMDWDMLSKDDELGEVVKEKRVFFYTSFSLGPFTLSTMCHRRRTFVACHSIPQMQKSHRPIVDQNQQTLNERCKSTTPNGFSVLLQR